MKNIIIYTKEVVNPHTGEWKKVKVYVSHGFDALGDYYGKYKEEIVKKRKITIEKR